MPFEIKYSSDFYRIEADEQAGMLRALWLRPITEKEMIAGGTKLYQVLCETKAERVIGNAKNVRALTSETKDWMANTFYEMLSQTNLRKLARVLPENKFHQLGLESVITRAEALGKIRFAVKNFHSEREALAWLGV